MRFIVEGKSLQQQLQAVSKVINSKNTLSILDNFLLRMDGDKLYITGSDQENTMTACLEVSDSEGTGEVAVSAKRLLEIVKEIAGQPLTFDVNDDNKEIEVSFLNGRFSFMGVDAAQYPRKVSSAEELISMDIPSSVIKKGIDSTIFAVSPEAVRPIMTGIYWDIHMGDITFVSSDTHKLVRYIDSRVQPGMECSFIMPSKPANILRSLLSGNEDDMVHLEFDSKGATFTFGNYTLSNLFIKGNYPNYNRVIPEKNPFVVEVDRVSLLTALRRVAIFAAKSSNLVVIELGDTGMVLSTQDLDYATAATEKVTCSYEGNPMTIGFNCQFMIEVLNNLDCDTILLKLSDPARPGIYTPLEQKENEDIVVIQMPMQVL